MKYWLIDKIFNHPSKPRQIEYLVVDENFIILDISEQIQQFSEHPHQVNLGKDIRESFPELIGFEDTLTGLLKGQQDIFELKGIARIADSNIILYIDIYAVRDRDEENLAKLLFLMENVTEKMVLEQDLAQTMRETLLHSISLDASKNYLDQILYSMPDALIVTTGSGKIKTVNQATIDLFGYRELELIGQPILMLLADEQIYEKECGKFLKDIKLRGQSKTGKKIDLIFSRATIQTELEKCQYLVYVVRELTIWCGGSDR